MTFRPDGRGRPGRANAAALRSPTPTRSRSPGTSTCSTRRNWPARKNVKNLWITCGYIQAEPLAELCQCLDAANVNLKSFSDEVYAELNSGKLQPVLDTLTALRRMAYGSR